MFRLNEKIYVKNKNDKNWIRAHFICSFEGKNYFCYNGYEIQDNAIIKSFDCYKTPDYRPFEILDDYINILKEKWIYDRNNKNKAYKIIAFSVEKDVPIIKLHGFKLTLDDLFRLFIFEDGTPVGVEITDLS